MGLSGCSNDDASMYIYRNHCQAYLAPMGDTLCSSVVSLLGENAVLETLPVPSDVRLTPWMVICSTTSAPSARRWKGSGPMLGRRMLSVALASLVRSDKEGLALIRLVEGFRSTARGSFAGTGGIARVGKGVAMLLGAGRFDVAAGRRGCGAVDARRGWGADTFGGAGADLAVLPQLRMSPKTLRVLVFGLVFTGSSLRFSRNCSSLIPSPVPKRDEGIFRSEFLSVAPLDRPKLVGCDGFSGKAWR